MTRRLDGDPPVFTLSVRTDPERGGPVGPTVSDSGLRTAPDVRHLLILVHGFNNTASEAEASYGVLLNKLIPALRPSRARPDAIAKFQWPGDLAVGPLKEADAVAYPQDIDQARQSARRLAVYLVDLARLRPQLTVSFIGHSLGCRLIAETLSDPILAATPSLRFDVVSLMAAALPADLVQLGAPLAWTGQAARTTLKLFSELDWVLHLAFPTGQFAAAILGIEQAIYTDPVGRHGHPPGFAVPIQRPNMHGQYWNDDVARDSFVTAVDPTLSTRLSANILPESTLASARGIGTRALPERSLAA